MSKQEFINQVEENQKNSKYYTPSIEEFHVGFEHEIWDDMNDGDYQWFPTIFGGIVGGLSALQYSLDITVVNGILNQGGIRVKYLDRSDIESLGFEDDAGAGVFFRKRIHIDEEIHLNFNNTILIERCCVMDENPIEVVFKGTIKNKSELKKILKMIGV